MQTQSPGALSSGAAAVCAFLSEFGVHKASAVHVVGRGALPALLWLCRHGYERGLMLAVARTPTETADLLLALSVSSPHALDHLAADLPRVRPGGAVIVLTHAARHAESEAVRALLSGAGLRLERRVRRGRRDIWVGRRDSAIATPAAA